MSIDILNFDGSRLTTITDGTIDSTATSLNLVGRGYKGWGQPTQQNLLWVMQNFAGETPPPNPITGQMWYDTTSGVETMKVWNGFQWSSGSSISANPVSPGSGANVGSLWYDSSTKQLYTWSGTSWDLVGPLGAKNNLDPEDPLIPLNSSIEAMSVRAVEDSSLHQVWRITIGGALFAIFSKDQVFTPYSTRLTSNGFSKIYPGITFNSNLANIGVSGDTTNFKGTQTNLPAIDNTYALGSFSRRFSDVYTSNALVTGTLTSSGQGVFTGSATFSAGNVTFGSSTAYVQSTRWLPGNLLLTPMLGAVEFDGNYFYFTTTVGGTSVRQSPLLVTNPLIPELTNISKIGPFVRSGLTVGVYLDEVSNDPTLTHTNPTFDNTTVPTQYAVKQYLQQIGASIVPSQDGTINIGSAIKRWATIYGNIVAKTTTTDVLNVTTLNASSVSLGSFSVPLLPSSDGTVNIGSPSLRWLTMYGNVSGSTATFNSATSTSITATNATITNATLTNVNAGTIVAASLQTNSISISSISTPTISTTTVIASVGNLSTLNSSVGNITNLTTNELVVSGNISVGGNVTIDNVGARQFIAASTDTISRPGFSWKGNTNTGMYRPTTNTIGLVVNALEALRIDANGNLTTTGTTATTGYNLDLARGIRVATGDVVTITGTFKQGGSLPASQNDTTVATTSWVKTNAGFQGHIVHTTSGAGTGTIPAGITKVKVTVVGAGGAGGSSAGSAGRAGAGGGAGGMSVKYYTGSLGGLTYNYTVGAGGAPTGGGAGGTGGTSSFTLSGVTISANGGVGGAYGSAASTNYAGGAGGTATGGDYNVSGSAGDNSIGTNAAATCKGGNGGTSAFSGAGRGGVTGSPATAGSANSGSGGGGSVSTTGAAQTGAAGGTGIVIIEY